MKKAEKKIDYREILRDPGKPLWTNYFDTGTGKYGILIKAFNGRLYLIKIKSNGLMLNTPYDIVEGHDLSTWAVDANKAWYDKYWEVDSQK